MNNSPNNAIDGGELMVVRINSSLHRPDSLWGAERKPMLFAAMISAMFILGLSLAFLIMGVIVWLVLSYLLRTMYKADPFLRLIYLNNVKYNPYYPPHSGLHAEPRKLHDAKKLH